MAAPIKTIELIPLRKQGLDVTYSSTLDWSLLVGVFSVSAEFINNFPLTATFKSYTYGTKGKGKDAIFQGDDTDQLLTTGLGNETMFMGGGIDVVLAGGGDDKIYGEGGNDILLGEAGNDILIGGAGFNFIDGGADDDTVSLEDGFSGDYVNLASGEIHRDGEDAGRVYRVENILGSENPDTLIGNQFANEIDGNGGGDVFVGGGNDDTITLGTDGAVDHVYWAAADGRDTVFSFSLTDEDMFHFDLADFDPNDYEGTTTTVEAMVVGGYIKFSEWIPDQTLIQIDADGGGNFEFASGIVVDGVQFTDNVNIMIAEFDGHIVDDAFSIA